MVILSKYLRRLKKLVRAGLSHFLIAYLPLYILLSTCQGLVGHLKQDFDTGTHLSRVYLHVINIHFHCSVLYPIEKWFYKIGQNNSPARVSQPTCSLRLIPPCRPWAWWLSPLETVFRCSGYDYHTRLLFQRRQADVPLCEGQLSRITVIWPAIVAINLLLVRSCGST